MSTTELEATLHLMRTHQEVHKFLLAMAYGALAQRLRDPNDPENPMGFLDRSKGWIKPTKGNEHLEEYIKEFFDLARSFVPSETAEDE